MNTRNSVLLLMYAVTSIASIADASEENATRIDEVVVTAQRREQTLLEVPISTTVLSGSELEASRVQSVGDIFRQAPNVSFAEAGSRSRVEISMRGIQNLPRDLTLRRNAFAFYVDEFNTVAGTFNPALQDIERIEILRGPQGTFFGRNAVGGAVNLIMKQPVNRKEGSLTLDMGRYDTWMLGAIANTPLIDDRLFVRVNAQTTRSDGFITNTNPRAGRDIPDSSAYDYQNYRIALRWEPNEDFSADLSATFANEHEDFRAGVATGTLSPFVQGFAGFIGFGGIAPPLPFDSATGQFSGLDEGSGFWPRNDDKVNFNDPQGFDTDYSIVTYKMQYEMDRVAITSITGWVDRDTLAELGDIDNTSVDYFTEFTKEDRDSLSTELRLASTGEWLVDWTTGAIVARDRGKSAQDTFCPPPCSADFFGTAGPEFLEFLDGTGQLDSWAVFADATWHASSRLDLTAGVRYSEDDVEETLLQQTNFGGGVVNVANSVDRASFSEVTPRIAATYFPTESSSIYATASRGYRPGGVQTNFLLPNATFDKETVWNYEVGARAAFWGDRASVNIALFRMEYNDIQVEQRFDIVGPGGGITFAIGTGNVPNAVSQGAELDITLKPVESITLRSAVGYTDAQFGSFDTTINNTAINLDGYRLPGAPEWTANLTGQYDFPLMSDVSGFIRLEGYYRSETIPLYNDLPLTTLGHRAPAFDTWNLRVGAQNDKYSISAYVENIFNEDYFTTSYEKGFLSGIFIAPNPMHYGIRMSVNF